MVKIGQYFKCQWVRIIRALNEKHEGFVNIKPSKTKESLPRIQYVASESYVTDEQLKMQASEIKRIAIETQMVISEMPNEFGKALKYLREKSNLTQEKLFEKSEVSVSTLRRMETDIDYKPSKISVAKICIGLGLNPIISQSLFELTESKLNNSVENIKIKIILYDSYLKNIDEAKLLLNMVDIKTDK